MTGGAGFSRTGQNAIKQNKDLRTGRSRMKDNPYVSSKAVERKNGVANYEEIKKWKIRKYSSERRARMIISFFISVLLLLMFFIWIN